MPCLTVCELYGAVIIGRAASTVGVVASAGVSVGSGAFTSKIASLSVVGWVGTSSVSLSLAATLVTTASA